MKFLLVVYRVGHDVVQPRHTPPSGPMTRARVKALHDKVNSLLSMCDLDTPLNGLLLHSDTLCILRNHLDDDPQWSRGDEQEKVQDDGEDAQEKTQEDGQEEEEVRGKEARNPEKVPAVTTGPSRPVLPPSRQMLLDPMPP